MLLSALESFQMFTSLLFETKLYSLSIVLFHGFQSSLGALKSTEILVNSMGLVGIVNAAVYDTETIFTCLRHGKLSWFLTLHRIPYILPQQASYGVSICVFLRKLTI